MSAVSIPISALDAPRAPGKGAARAGWALSGLVSLFLLMDGAAKIAGPAPVKGAFVKLGQPLATAVPLGVVLIAVTIVYLVPRLSVIGAVLLTGFLGGAVATHVRASGTAFEIVFPIVTGLLVWGGLFLRDLRVRALIS